MCVCTRTYGHTCRVMQARVHTHAHAHTHSKIFEWSIVLSIGAALDTYSHLIVKMSKTWLGLKVATLNSNCPIYLFWPLPEFIFSVRNQSAHMKCRHKQWDWDHEPLYVYYKLDIWSCSCVPTYVRTYHTRVWNKLEIFIFDHFLGLICTNPSLIWQNSEPKSA